MPYYVACGWKDDKSESMKILKLLQEHALDVNAVDKYGCALLHWATWQNCPDLVDFLMENENVDAQLKVLKDFNDFEAGETALDIAERKNLTDILKMLKPPEMTNPVFWKIFCVCNI